MTTENPTDDVLTFDIATLRSVVRLLDGPASDPTALFRASRLNPAFINGWQADRAAVIGALRRLIEEGAAT